MTRTQRWLTAWWPAMNALLRYTAEVACDCPVDVAVTIGRRNSRWRRKHAAPSEISADRLKDLSTGHLTQLAPQFRMLTVCMYDELCIRRLAEKGTAQLEAMLRPLDEATP